MAHMSHIASRVGLVKITAEQFPPLTTRKKRHFRSNCNLGVSFNVPIISGKCSFAIGDT